MARSRSRSRHVHGHVRLWAIPLRRVTWWGAIASDLAGSRVVVSDLRRCIQGRALGWRRVRGGCGCRDGRSRRVGRCFDNVLLGMAMFVPEVDLENEKTGV